MKHALLLGGTGAMGSHLSSILARDGWRVTVTSRSERQGASGVEYTKGNAKNPAFLADMLAVRQWDVIVDFMIWSTAEFRVRKDLLLGACGQYVYLSSYRVFDSSAVITERSPRLVDSCRDSAYLATDEYALAKGRQEDLLRDSRRDNWTIVRPTVTYSRGRYQLGVLECYEWLPRVLSGHAVPMPSEMLFRQATMTWGGDAAMMISRLCGNSSALGEDFNVCTSRHRSWREVANAYCAYVPLELRECSVESYERHLGRRYQIRYDRLVDRVMDNSKILDACGLSEGDLLSLEDGLEYELKPYLDGLSVSWRGGGRIQGRLDRLTNEFCLPGCVLTSGGFSNYAKYIYGRFID